MLNAQFNQPVLPLLQSQSVAQVGGESPRLPLKQQENVKFPSLEKT